MIEGTCVTFTITFISIGNLHDWLWCLIYLDKRWCHNPWTPCWPLGGLCKWRCHRSDSDPKREMLPDRVLSSGSGELSHFLDSRSVCKVTILPRVPMLQEWDNLEARNRLLLLCIQAGLSVWLLPQEESNSFLRVLLEYKLLFSTSLELLLPFSYSCHCMSSNRMASCSILHRLGKLVFHSSCSSWAHPRGHHKWPHQCSTIRL